MLGLLLLELCTSAVWLHWMSPSAIRRWPITLPIASMVVRTIGHVRPSQMSLSGMGAMGGLQFGIFF